MSYNKQKKLAAKILKCGETRIWIDPRSEKVKQAITRRDIRGFVSEGIIKKLPAKKNNSTAKTRQQKKGSKKGRFAARDGKKSTWLRAVRPQRRLLKEMREKSELIEGAYRKVYRRVKGGAFRSKAHLTLYLKNKGLFKEAK
ncbi:MAG: 50S ribosomal protein L19e [Candidatus Aenigmarchaeota archaeon]|nr:50S ribosomal protein L19e [Candidatus Aenigmarchaeota archaeon]